jgi:hypothetical protein
MAGSSPSGVCLYRGLCCAHGGQRPCPSLPPPRGEVRPANPRKAPTVKAPYTTHGGNTVADSELIMNYLRNAYLSHEEGAASDAGARPTSGDLAFPAMTPEQQARRCVHCGSVDNLAIRVRDYSGSLTPFPGYQRCAFGRAAALLTPRGVTVPGTSFKLFRLLLLLHAAAPSCA